MAGDLIDHLPFLHRFRAIAADLLRDRERLLEFLDGAAGHAEKLRGDMIYLGEEVACSVRLLRAWATGDYNETPFHTLAALTTILVYLILIVGGGPPGWLGKALTLAVELVVLKRCYANVRAELEVFRRWELAYRPAARPRLVLVWSAATEAPERAR